MGRLLKDNNINMIKTRRAASVIVRILAGLVFLFSGFVKAVDPLGSTYKFIDYFYAFNMPWMEPGALPLSIILSGTEFLIGICLVFNIMQVLANWGALLFMAFFTPLTLWLALTNPVQDCGCFGDAIILTNWETFYKNIIISILVIFAFLNRKNKNIILPFKVQLIVLLINALFITGFSFYNFIHLPVMDFRPYSIGTYIPEKMFIPEDAAANVYEQYFTLTDTLTGKTLTLESYQYLDDSTYWHPLTTWKFISSTDPVMVKRGFQPDIHDFNITSLSGEDITSSVLTDTSYYFIVISYDLVKSDKKYLEKIIDIYRNAVSENHKFICLTSSTQDEIEKFRMQYKTPYKFYLTDPITLKTIIRANPGLMVLKGGTILGKWNSRDIPEYTIIKKYLNHDTDCRNKR